MTTTLRVRFDGNVIVPMQPADLPTDREFEIRVSDPLIDDKLDSPPSHLSEATDHRLVEYPPDSISRPVAMEPARKTALQKLGDLLNQLLYDADMPSDAVAQHDHYLYGIPKQP